MKNPFARVLCFAFLLPLLVACPATVPPVPPGPEDAGTALPLDAGLTAPRCGDGALDTGETCDDGNLADGDGCSARCTRELGCAGARDLLTLAQSGPGETRIVAGARPAANSTLQASCGGAGAEQVYLFQAPFAGSLTASVQGGQGTTLSLRRTCAEALTETACAPAPRQVRAELVAGEALAFVIDGPEAGGPFTVQVQFLRARAAGEACDPARQLDVCAAGAALRRPVRRQPRPGPLQRQRAADWSRGPASLHSARRHRCRCRRRGAGPGRPRRRRRAGTLGRPGRYGHTAVRGVARPRHARSRRDCLLQNAYLAGLLHQLSCRGHRRAVAAGLRRASLPAAFSRRHRRPGARRGRRL
jgi:cysteine-rich repeat protein